MNGVNRVCSILEEGRPAFGMFIMLPCPAVVEVVGSLGPLGLDFLAVDAQHQVFNPETLAQMIRAADLAGLSCVVRVGPHDSRFAELVLDLGAAGVIFPVVNNVSDAREAVSACRYPPRGSRSVGGLRNIVPYGAESGHAHEPLCIIQIEHAEALKVLHEILSVQGIDAVLPGPVDLATSMGLAASYGSFQKIADEVRSVVAEIERTAAKYGIARMRHCETSQAAKIALEEGCDLVTLSSDAALLLQSAKQLVEGSTGTTEAGSADP